MAHSLKLFSRKPKFKTSFTRLRTTYAMHKSSYTGTGQPEWPTLFDEGNKRDHGNAKPSITSVFLYDCPRISITTNVSATNTFHAPSPIYYRNEFDEDLINF